MTHVFRTLARIAVAVGAVGSIGLTLFVGHRNQSSLLVVLFVGWVLSPFIALGLMEVVSTRWSAASRTTLHGVMIVLALCSLAIYGIVAAGRPTGPRAAFLMVPFASFLVMAIVVPTALRLKPPRAKPPTGL
jgi:ACR3 family arsenite efflux pump ArsB